MLSLLSSLLLIFVVLLLSSSSSSSSTTTRAVAAAERSSSSLSSTPTRHLRKSATTATSSSSTSTKSSRVDDSSRGEDRQLIVGGKDATHNQYPKSIVYLSDREDGLSCGGTLISPTIVLAAGHCEISLVTDAVFLRYYHPSGVNKDEDGNENEIRISVKSEIKHPDFNLRTLENDVMLLILEESPNYELVRVPYMKLHTPSDPSLDELVELMNNSGSNGILDSKGNGNGRFRNTAKINYNSISNQENEPKARKIGDKLRSKDEIEEETAIAKATATATSKTATNESNKARQIGDKLRSDDKSDGEEEDTETTAVSVNPKHTALTLKALGWGHTTNSGNTDNNPLQRSEAAELLQEATLHYVLDEECNNARDESESDKSLSYEGRIQSDMMCTWQSKQDTCHGDSGGPIYLEAPHNSDNNTQNQNERDQYVQVGIVSWGEDCADEIFPGVASRVSMSYEWIRRRVCSIDGTHPGTPTSFECDSLLDTASAPSSLSYTFSPAPSSSPSTKIDKVDAEVRSDAMELLDGTLKSSETELPVIVDATVEIHFDVFAVEQAWKLVDAETGIAIRDYPFETYQYENYIQEQNIQLEVGRTYDFSIYDQYGDGITNNGYYQIYYSIGEEEEVDLVPATEFTGHEQHHQFTVPSISTSISTSTTTIPTTTLSSSALPSSSSTMAAFALVSSSSQTVAASTSGRNGGSPTERLRKKGNPKDRSPP